MSGRKKILVYFLASLSAVFFIADNNVFAQQALVSVQSPDFKVYDIIRAGRLGKNNDYQFASRDVIIRQDRTYFYSDSISLNTITGIMEAFGRVHINDADSVHIYTNYLRYRGKERTAFLKGNVKVTDGSGVLTTEQLDYDMNTSVGVYKSGGKLVNGQTVLTSTRGTYYGDTRDVTFFKNVLLVDPQYRITTDSLLYNTSTRIANFVVPTVITSGNDRKIVTTDGSYNMDSRQAYFGTRSTIVDSTTTLIADEVAYDDRNGFGEARGNAILKDSVQGIVVIANNIKTNKSESAFLATVNPLAIMAQEGDSTYVASDTIYSGRLTDRIQGRDYKDIESDEHTPVLDSANYNVPNTVDEEIRPHMRRELLPENNRLQTRPQPVSTAPRAGTNNLNRILDVEPDSTSEGLVATADTLINPVDRGKTTPSVLDRGIAVQRDSASANRGRPGMPDFSLPTATMEESDQPEEEDNKNRFVEAYYNVRIYNDSLQAVCDSMFYSSQDSIFRLLRDPIVWSNSSNQFLQLTGDTIFVHTLNRKPSKIDVWKDAMAISQPLVNGIAGNTNYYNQITGNYLFAYFTDGEMDSVQSRYNAQSIYYLLDEQEKYLGVNQQQSEILDFYFENKQLLKIVGRMDVQGTTYPMGQVNHTSIRLPGYQLHNDLRPKSKYDLFAPEITDTPDEENVSSDDTSAPVVSTSSVMENIEAATQQEGNEQ